MPVGSIDEKWRVTIPREARRSMRLMPRSLVDMKLGKDSLVIVPVRKGNSLRRSDSLTWLLNHPVHVDSKKLRRIDLNKVEEEMWLP